MNDSSCVVAKEKIKKLFLDTSADRKSELAGGPKKGSGVMFRNCLMKERKTRDGMVLGAGNSPG